MGSSSNPSKPYFRVVSLRLACLHCEMSTCLVNLISSLELHAGKTSQSKQTTNPKKEEVVNAGSEGPRGQSGTTLVADH